MVLENYVRYREVHTIKRSILIANLRLVSKNGVHYVEVSAIKHVRYREVPMYTRKQSALDNTEDRSEFYPKWKVKCLNESNVLQRKRKAVVSDLKKK